MKILIASDLHGSEFYTRALIEEADKRKAAKILLLGDLYYHGPRNPLPKGYAPMKVAELLNGNKDRIIAVRGNCDADVDCMISEFPLCKDVQLFVEGTDFRSIICRLFLLARSFCRGILTFLSARKRTVYYCLIRVQFRFPKKIRQIRFCGTTANFTPARLPNKFTLCLIMQMQNFSAYKLH